MEGQENVNTGMKIENIKNCRLFIRKGTGISNEPNCVCMSACHPVNPPK